MLLSHNLPMPDPWGVCMAVGLVFGVAALIDIGPQSISHSSVGNAWKDDTPKEG